MVEEGEDRVRDRRTVLREILGGLVRMAIGGSGLWIEGCGELCPMMQLSQLY